MSAPPPYDARAEVLISTLSQDFDNFVISCHNLPKRRAVGGVYEYHKLKYEMIEFARDPTAGMEVLGPRPVPPPKDKMAGLPENEQYEMERDYEEQLRLWETARRAMQMHVPLDDMLMIDRFFMPFDRALAATNAIKAQRFKAFTKDVEKPDSGLLGGLLSRGQQRQ